MSNKQNSHIKGLNLIVDTNYILYRAVYTLAKTNTLFGDLEQSLKVSFNNYLLKYPFNKIYMVSDAKSSWRKRIYSEYKAQRKEQRDKQEEINWEFVFNTYDKFKIELKNNRIVSLQADNVEGDDWVRFLVEDSNKKGLSTLFVASDRDLNQLLDFRITSQHTYINIQWYDNFKNGKIYLPKGYKLFMKEITNSISDDLFSTNENIDFINLFKDLESKNVTQEVDKELLLFSKIISGDVGDNIDSVLKTPTKTNPDKFQGIGEAGALKIYEKFKIYYPYDINFEEDNWIDDAMPYILEYKKVNNEYHDIVNDKIKLNRQLIHLHENHLPNDIKKKLVLI